MKKFVSLLCGAVLTFSAVNCSAMIASEKIALGGISPGMTTAEVLRIAGQPKSKSSDGEEWYYENFVVEFDEDSPDVVEEVSTKRNSVSTPDNITVGQNDGILNNTYGPADSIKQKNNAIKYTYFNEEFTKKIKFTVVNGVITKIKCSIADFD